ncbi:MAG TPA: metallophosphoesterase [Pirellulales bacterium]|nr:metallophosphoesterase [Pirellulales bacterium]
MNDQAEAAPFQPLAELRRRQTRLIPGTHEKPFLETPARFQAAASPADIRASQVKQMVVIPPPKRNPPVIDLAELIGDAEVNEIETAGQFVFHAVGDTGNPKHTDLTEVASVMSRDYYRSNPADRPALFLHLGDVCYNMYDDATNQVIPAPKSGMYQTQFYTPYADYPGKIIAIPGNHDSNPQEDPQSLATFELNFCADLPANAAAVDALIGSHAREPMYQPGVYYLLDAPFAQIIALFSNGGETAGAIRDHDGAVRTADGTPIGEQQWQFLLNQLTQIQQARTANPAQRKALILAVHHPPFSGGGGHSGSSEMLADLDAAFAQAQIVPDVVLSGHAHNYQRFTRTVPAPGGGSLEVPYLVAGNGGHGITNLKNQPDGTRVATPVPGADSETVGTHSLQQYFNGFGHLLVTITTRIVTVDLIGTHTHSQTPVDSVTVDLRTRQITHETPSFSHPALGEKEQYRAPA